LCAPDGWINFDASPSLRLQRLPLVGRCFKSPPFPQNVRYGDIVQGLPLAKDSCEAIYCSHVLEHLSLTDLQIVLRNTRSYLKEGGVFRLVVPDLECLAQSYLKSQEADAAIRFVENTGLGLKERPRKLAAFFRSWLGHSRHRWMWDFKALSMELAQAGFCGVRRAIFGDSRLACFKAVEDPARWKDCLGIECAR